jgi:hypothetical protein
MDLDNQEYLSRALSNVQMYNAQNGARIKAFAGPGVGSGIVKNISFSFFTEGNVDNPLIVDQVRAHLLMICKRLIICLNTG